MDLSIIIVNWNSKDYLEKCIASLYSNTQEISFEIIVIDGASFDGCDKMLGQKYPQVKFIQGERNLGFAKANNEAYRLSCGKNLLFLNPDTEVDAGSVSVLLRQLEVLPNAGIVGARLLNTDKSIQTSCIRKFPTILNQSLDTEALRRLFPRLSLWGMEPLFNNHESPNEVEAVSGACLMIKREVFQKVSKFSNDYFMFSEDIDICYKVCQAGLKTYYIPTATIIHHGGASSSKSNVNMFSSVMMLESRFRFFEKTRSTVYSQLYRISIIIVSVVRIFLIFLFWPALRIINKSHFIELSLKKWTARFRWSIGCENWVKSY
jgi:N-acetylglucosaminyl-diphospho-decaprenol L-rhamnosyltransferase